jgi:hypothetical protein
VLYGEGERETGREREKQGGIETGSDSDDEGEREKQEGERDVENVQNCLFLKGMTGALAPFSYLVLDIF